MYQREQVKNEYEYVCVHTHKDTHTYTLYALKQEIVFDLIWPIKSTPKYNLQ